MDLTSICHCFDKTLIRLVFRFLFNLKHVDEKRIF